MKDVGSHLGAERRGVMEVVGADALIVGLGTEVRDLALSELTDPSATYGVTSGPP